MPDQNRFDGRIEHAFLDLKDRLTDFGVDANLSTLSPVAIWEVLDKVNMLIGAATQTAFSQCRKPLFPYQQSEYRLKEILEQMLRMTTDSTLACFAITAACLLMEPERRPYPTLMGLWEKGGFSYLVIVAHNGFDTLPKLSVFGERANLEYFPREGGARDPLTIDTEAAAQELMVEASVLMVNFGEQPDLSEIRTFANVSDESEPQALSLLHGLIY